MKNLPIILTLFFALSFLGSNATISQQKKIVTDTLLVPGNCNICKERIENAALVKGVKKVEWNKYEQTLVVIYDESKTNLDIIQRSVADSGHDTPKFKAKETVYSKLPGCCKYRDKNSIH